MLLDLWNVLWRRTAQTTSADSALSQTANVSASVVVAPRHSTSSVASLLNVSLQTAPTSILTASAVAHFASATSAYDVTTENATTVSNTYEATSTVSDTKAKGAS